MESKPLVIYEAMCLRVAGREVTTTASSREKYYNESRMRSNGGMAWQWQMFVE